METGCQNIQLCVTILKVAFPPQVIGPMFLFPLFYYTFQCSEALLLTLSFRGYRALRPPTEGKCHSCLCVCIVVERGWWGWRGWRGTWCTLLNCDQRKQKSNFTLLLHRRRWCQTRGGEAAMTASQMRMQLFPYSSLRPVILTELIFYLLFT